MATYYLTQRDARVHMTATLRNADGTVINLSDASTVTFHLGYEGDPQSVLVQGTCAVVDAEGGRVSYLWTAEDTDLSPGSYDAEFQIAWADGTLRTVPSKAGGFKVVVRGEVG
jgi:hypothetical protein